MRKIIVLFLSGLIMLFSSCGKINTETDSADSVVFIDALGRNVSVNKKIERVAALKGSFADVWVLAGGNLCAAPSDAWEDFELELDNCVNIGGAHSPDVELLLSSEPELVIASASTAADVEMLDLLEKAGIAVAYFDVDCFDDYLDMLKICTEITCRDDLYKTNGLDIKNQVDEIKLEVKNLQLDEKERSILILRASSSSVKAKGSEGTILGEMLRDLGCINIADSDTALLENLTTESVLQSDPYRIFVVAMGDDVESAYNNVKKLFNENPVWNELNAVKENRVHYMDKQLFNLKPNSRWGEAYDKLFEILCG